uniref:Uncharacterized protein n=1 Tax=Nyssomyia neivai TaxID=330878 RepID=A0A1L8DK78_9DIPT
MEIQEQIYVLAGVFGGVCLLLLLFVCYLMFSMSEMQSRMKSRDRSERGDHRSRQSRDEFAYANPSIVAGEELNRRGYHMHDMPQNEAQSGLAAAAANRFRSQMSSDAGTKDASRDFSSTLNNDEIVFGGNERHSFNRSRSIPNPPPPLGKQSNYNDNISYPGAPVNPMGRQENRGYFNSRGGGY